MMAYAAHADDAVLGAGGMGRSDAMHPAVVSMAHEPPFRVAKRDLVTGETTLEAIVRDPAVSDVKWLLDDGRTFNPAKKGSFSRAITLDVVPYERRVRAVALDARGEPLYEQATTINPGGKALDAMFLSPLMGQSAHGATPVIVEASVPAPETVSSVVLSYGVGSADAYRHLVLTHIEDGKYGGMVDLPAGLTVLEAMVTTDERALSRTIMVNTPPGSYTEGMDVRVVQQMLTRRGAKAAGGLDGLRVENAKTGKAYEVLDAVPLEEARFRFCVAIDLSASMTYGKDLRDAMAADFVERIMQDDDSAFIYGFGDFMRTMHPWSRDRVSLSAKLGSIRGANAETTPLYDALTNIIYAFQGAQGAKAIFLVTDGWDNTLPKDTPVAERRRVEEERERLYAHVLDYARQSGVQIYAVGIESMLGDGKLVANKKKLAELAEATGGKSYVIFARDKAEAREKIDDVVESLIEDLSHQVVVSYKKPAGDNAPVRIGK